LDQQVKIRGFRVELEEIEEQLLLIPAIKEAVVVARSKNNQEKYLCAYFVPQPDTAESVNIASLREHLSLRLPYYMIPSYFVPLEKIPLTPNRKIDRKALPEPEITREQLGKEYIAPESDSEKVIVRIWQEILHVDEIGVNDNFFDLGGNSLNVIQLGWKIQQEFNKEIPTAVLFRNLSIRFLAEYLQQDDHDNQKLDDIRRGESLTRARDTYKATVGKFLRK